MNPIGWGGANGWIYELEDGGEFVVATQGKEVDVKLIAPEGNASLESYTYTTSGGRTLSPEGMEYTIKSHIGETVYVTPRPGLNSHTSSARTADRPICSLISVPPKV